MMPSCLLSLVLLLVPIAQQVPQAPEIVDGLTPAERARLARESKIDGRIKVYQSASERYRDSLGAAMSKHDYSVVSGILQGWGDLLKASLKDIDSSITNRKKKSKALIRFEIQLRKSISDVQGYKTAAPIEVFDQFDSWLKLAEDVHQNFVDILFPR